MRNHNEAHWKNLLHPERRAYLRKRLRDDFYEMHGKKQLPTMQRILVGIKTKENQELEKINFRKKRKQQQLAELIQKKPEFRRSRSQLEL